MSDQNTMPEGLVPLSEAVQAPGQAPPIVLEKTLSANPAYQPSRPIDFQLPDGRIIRMEKPAFSISQPVAKIMEEVNFKNPDWMEFEQNKVKSLLYITHIDGAQEPKIWDPIMRNALEQKLGIENLDAIFMMWIEHFPQVKKSDLKLIKK